jgi:hypothetical protein
MRLVLARFPSGSIATASMVYLPEAVSKGMVKIASSRRNGCGRPVGTSRSISRLTFPTTWPAGVFDERQKNGVQADLLCNPFMGYRQTRKRHRKTHFEAVTAAHWIEAQGGGAEREFGSLGHRRRR